jgi:hypothetical protein
MVTLSEVRKQADLLSREDKNGLLSYLLHELEAPRGAGDEEILERESEFEAGLVSELSQAEFVKQVGRGLP